jgi:DNA polymerase III epsilon subunit-like protein
MTVVYFDLETGGVLPQHPTIQLAAVAMDGYTEVGSFAQRIAFNEADADPEALAMNHYTREAWADAVPPGVAASRFAAWLRPYCSLQRVSKAGNPYQIAQLSGYNSLTFDEPRLRQMFGREFTPWDRRVRDVLQRALFWFDEHPDAPTPENFKLTTVAAMFGIETDGAHDALADARMCAALARSMADGD